ncbi:MAG: chloride channel protein [Bacteroidales bacterium]|nr:chloride channel protein [Bacteroidales bacterium]
MAREEQDWYLKMILWREKHIKESTFILLLSLLVGVFTSLAAWLLKTLIGLFHHLVEYIISLNNDYLLYLLFPALGIFLTAIFVRYAVRDDIGHGITKILYAISRRQGRIKQHNMWTSIVASSMTIGLGGSVGAEAPIVLTGSAIGSNLGSFFKMNHKTLMILIGCGAAGAISGIFKAPIAGMIFAIEVLMLDFTAASVMPMLVSAVTAATITYIISGTEATFAFANQEVFSLSGIPWVIVLGICCGFASLYLIRGMNTIEGWFKKMADPWLKILSGAVLLGILIFFFPPLYGEGYESIEALINENAVSLTENSLFFGLGHNFYILTGYFLLIILFKVFASAATNGAGGVGGVFAPTLFMGGFVGYIVGSVLNYYDLASVSPGLFALMGMAGLMSGVMHAPLTGIFLVAELTGGYSLFLPLMIVALVAYLTILVFEKHSIYSMRLAQKGELLTHHKDKAVLTLMKVENVIETDFDQVSPDATLGDLVKIISKAHRNAFPVVDHDGIFLGLVLMDDIRNIMFRQELYRRFKVRRLMISPPAVLKVTDSMEQVMRIFDDTNAWNLPVTDQDNHYVGFVSKSKIFNSYRKVLVHFSDE